MTTLNKDNLIGVYKPGNGEGITGEDLYQLLKSIPARARRNYLMAPGGHDVTGMSISRSDQQTGTWDFKLYLTTDED